MSTKTTFKRIALVTVAALGFGVLSVVPSNAAIGADTLTLSSSVASQTTAETATATSATATLKFLGSIGDSASVTASLVSGPGAAFPYIALVETATVQIDGADKAAGYVPNPYNTPVVVKAGSASAFATAKFKVYLGSDSLTAPATAGTYVVKLTPASVGASGALQAATAQTITITVTTAPSLDTTVVAAKSTAVLVSTTDTTTTTDATITKAKDASLVDEAGYIKVTLKNANGTTQTGESYTASISGPGLLGSGPLTTTYSGDARGRVIQVKAGDVVTVYGDGSSGVATVTVSTFAGAAIASKSLTFFGDATSGVATVKKPVIKSATAGQTGVISVVIKDAAGTVVSNLTSLYVTSSDTSVISNSYTSQSVSYADGAYLVAVSGVAAGTANVTVGTKSSAAATTGFEAAAVAVRVGGGTAELDGVSVTFDKGSYAPGELAVVTVTPLDAKGLTLANDTYTVFATGGLVASHTLANGATITGVEAHDGGISGTGTVAGVATYKIYIPAIEGDFKLTWKTSTEFATAANDSVAGSASVVVSSPGTAAATDAANDALDAANAATDAANTAAEAADAATTAAQEASDAVAALSESVTKLIAGLQAQIKSLAAVVAKIAKKVKA